jgi:dihydroxy-acid dehydratase
MSDEKKDRGLEKGLTSYGDRGFSLFLRKAFIKGAGYTDDALSRPVVGIVNTGSAYNPCHGNAPQLLDAVKRGVMLAGGLPIEFPTISIHESFAHPTSMYLRNLMSMDTEEMIRAQPMDAVVLIGGCDKTVPAQLMGAASANVPAISLVTGSMLTGSHQGERVGACTDCRRYWGKYRAEEIDSDEISRVNNQLVASVGTCSVMGTASTMACVTEALGMMVPGGASAPAVTADRIRVAERTGAVAVDLARRKLAPTDILTARSFENALRVLLAIGGLDQRRDPPHGRCRAAGHRAVARAPRRDRPRDAGARRPQAFGPALHGRPAPCGRAADAPARAQAPPPPRRDDRHRPHAGEEIEASGPGFPQDVVRPFANPLFPQGGIAVLRGNLAPGGSIIKQSAADARLMKHEGRAVVFENAEDLARRVDADDLDVTADDILVLKNIGPKGAPGMPEAGYLPIPKKLARAGVKDMVRISDGRMSGTAAGTIVLHVTPEAAIGGPLAWVQSGDRIRLDVEARELRLLVSDDEMARRRAASPVHEPRAARGYLKLFLDSVTQADKGVDFDFLRPS